MPTKIETKYNKWSWTAIPRHTAIYVTYEKVTFQHLVPPHTSFHSGYFGLFRTCEMAWPPVKEVFLSHFRKRIQMETFTTKRGGHLDLTRCLGLSPCQGKQAFRTQYTAPLLPHRVSRAVTRVVRRIPFPFPRDRAVHTTVPFSYVPFSPAGEEDSVGPHVQAAVFYQVFFSFLAQGSALAPSESSQTARSLSEKMDRWTGFWFHSPAGCFPHYNSLILAFPWDYWHVLPSCISTLRKAQRAQAARARSRPSPARTGKSIQARSPISSCL